MHVTETFVKLDPAGSVLFDITDQANFGRMGVLLFFTVSGFVIPNSLSGTPKAGARAFLISRFFRLFPLFWASILFALIVLYWIPGRVIDGTTVVANITMVPEFLGFKPVMGLYWTLSLELTFYSICLVLFCLGLHNNVWVLSFFLYSFSVFSQCEFWGWI